VIALSRRANSRRQRSCYGPGLEDIMNTWDENHLRPMLSVCAVVDHLADSVDLLAAWPAAAPNQCQQRIMASTDLTAGIFFRTQSRVQARCSTKTRRWLLSASYRSSSASGMQLDPEPDNFSGGTPLAGRGRTLEAAHWSCPSRPEMAGTGPRDSRCAAQRSWIRRYEVQTLHCS
jgi:hypothetical protein